MDKKEKYSLQDLCSIMETLRGPEGCPWDCEQSHDTLKGYLIEETYEVIEAINLKDDKMICEELGDVLLQVVFHSSIAKGKGTFNTDDVIAKIEEELCEVKMAIKNNDANNIKEELGDLLFAVVNLSRFIDANPELSLDSANEKFCLLYTSDAADE